MSAVRRVLDEVADECHAQVLKWGAQTENTAEVWGMILGEEVGEVCQAVMESRFAIRRLAERPSSRKLTEQALQSHRDHIRNELVQVAAVAVSWITQIDEGNATHA